MKSDNQISKFKKIDNDISLAHRHEVKILNVAMTQQATKNIDIISRHLDPGIFDNTDFIEAVRQLSIASKFTKIRILVNN